MTATWVWTIFAFIALIFASYNAWQAYKDLQAVKFLEANGARQILAKAALQAECGRVVVETILFAVGVVVLFGPHIWDLPTYQIVAPAKHPAPAWLPSVLGWGLVCAVGIIAANTYLAFRTRRRLRAYFARERLAPDV